MEKTKKVRITVDIQPEAYRRLGVLEDLLGASSKATIIRKGLEVFEAIAFKAQEGYDFYAVHPDDTKERVLIVEANRVASLVEKGRDGSNVFTS